MLFLISLITALSTSLLKDLGSAVTSVSEDRNVHVIILEAEGGVFSSGHDLKEVTGDNQNHGTYMDLFQLCSKVMIQIAESEKPIIAKVNGIANRSGWKSNAEEIPFLEKTLTLNSVEIIIEYNLEILFSIQIMKIRIQALLWIACSTLLKHP